MRGGHTLHRFLINIRTEFYLVPSIGEALMLDDVTSITCNVASMQTVLTMGRCLVLDAGMDLDSDALAGTSTATRHETGRHIIAHVSERRRRISIKNNLKMLLRMLA